MDSLRLLSRWETLSVSQQLEAYRRLIDCIESNPLFIDDAKKELIKHLDYFIENKVSDHLIAEINTGNNTFPDWELCFDDL